jgi:hypothetical protein
VSVLNKLFPRGMTTPWFTEDQDKVLRKILNWFRSEVVVPTVQESKLDYVQEYDSDLENFPVTNPFESTSPSPGTVAFGQQEGNLIVTGNNNISSATNEDMTLFGVKCDVEGVDKGWIQGTRVGFNGRKARRWSNDTQSFSGYAGEDSDVEFLKNPQSTGLVSCKITKSVAARITTIHSSTSTSPTSWTKIGEIRLPNNNFSAIAGNVGLDQNLFPTLLNWSARLNLLTFTMVDVDPNFPSTLSLVSKSPILIAKGNSHITGGMPGSNLTTRIFTEELDTGLTFPIYPKTDSVSTETVEILFRLNNLILSTPNNLFAVEAAVFVPSQPAAETLRDYSAPGNKKGVYISGTVEVLGQQLHLFESGGT